jgi:membrane associated rhomboid family serine protease
MTRLGDTAALRVFTLLLLLGLVSVVFLWTLNPVSSQGQTTFTVYLSIDLVVFAMASYIYRKSKWKEGAGRVPLLGGCLMLLLLLFAGLIV